MTPVGPPSTGGKPLAPLLALARKFPVSDGPADGAVQHGDGKAVKLEVGTGVVRIVRCRWHSHGRVANEAA